MAHFYTCCTGKPTLAPGALVLKAEDWVQDTTRSSATNLVHNTALVGRAGAVVDVSRFALTSHSRKESKKSC